eukprot:GEMP01031828.1.p1 GENE.GEMP01031828.1~~GEMP01031828.1.p1  ORF type:complete len:208 (+),score=32.71 GEMP01031828.1:55-678(+)
MYTSNSIVVPIETGPVVCRDTEQMEFCRMSSMDLVIQSGQPDCSIAMPLTPGHAQHNSATSASRHDHSAGKRPKYRKRHSLRDLLPPMPKFLRPPGIYPAFSCLFRKRNSSVVSIPSAAMVGESADGAYNATKTANVPHFLSFKGEHGQSSIEYPRAESCGNGAIYVTQGGSIKSISADPNIAKNSTVGDGYDLPLVTFGRIASCGV